MRILALSAILALSVGCASIPNINASLEGTGVAVTSDLGDLTVSTTGVDVSTPEFQAGFTACVNGGGRVAAAIGTLPGVGDLILRFVSCPE